jgi:prolyl-tRNA synthetase
MDGLPARVRALLDEIQGALFARALKFQEDHTHRAYDYDTFKATMEGRPGFVIAPWCGDAACEAQIKADTQATIRNMPIDAKAPEGRHCVRCDRPAVAEAWFAKAY